MSVLDSPAPRIPRPHSRIRMPLEIRKWGTYTSIKATIFSVRGLRHVCSIEFVSLSATILSSKARVLW